MGIVIDLFPSRNPNTSKTGSQRALNHPSRGGLPSKAGDGAEGFRVAIRPSVLVDGEFVGELTIRGQTVHLVMTALGVAELLDELAMDL